MVGMAVLTAHLQRTTLSSLMPRNMTCSREKIPNNSNCEFVSKSVCVRESARESVCVCVRERGLV